MMQSVILCLVAAATTTYAAMCGKSEYFEYKFKPLKAGPVNEADLENANGRCGSLEKHCELAFMVYGTPQCKKGKHKEGELLKGPEGKNSLTNEQFEPNEVGWKVHSDFELHKAFENPFVFHLCDLDGAFRGGNDEIFTVQHQHLQEGCHKFRFEEDATKQKHPWFSEYEICCRPIAKAGFFRGQVGGK